MQRKNVSEKDQTSSDDDGISNIDAVDNFSRTEDIANQKRRGGILAATAVAGGIASVLTVGVLAPPSALAVLSVFSWNQYKKHKENKMWAKKHGNLPLMDDSDIDILSLLEEDNPPSFKK